MSNNFRPRVPVEKREAGRDYFDDIQEWEKQSLGYTEAAQEAMGVREEVRPDGYLCVYNCVCGETMPVVMEWSEVAMIAHGLLPSDPRMPGGALTKDQWVMTPQGMSPIFRCSRCNHSGPMLAISKTDAEKVLSRALQHNFPPRYDQKWSRVQQAFNGRRVQMGLPPI